MVWYDLSLYFSLLYLLLQFSSHWNQFFNSLSAMGKLLITNVHPIDPQFNGYLVKASFYSVASETIVVVATGVHAPQGVEIILKCIRSIIKVRG